jgi:hypothetical protein
LDVREVEPGRGRLLRARLMDSALVTAPVINRPVPATHRRQPAAVRRRIQTVLDRPACRIETPPQRSKQSMQRAVEHLYVTRRNIPASHTIGEFERRKSFAVTPGHAAIQCDCC